MTSVLSVVEGQVSRKVNPPPRFDCAQRENKKEHE